MQHAGQHDVVDVAALAGEDPRVLDRKTRAPTLPDADTLMTGHLGHSTAPSSRGTTSGEEHALDDALVAGAAADVAGQLLAHLALVGVGLVAQQRERRHHEAGRAEPALEGELSMNACWSGCSVSPSARPSIVVDVAAVGLHREHEARAHRLAVDEHRARAAHAVLAAEVGAGELELLAQEVGERHAHFGRSPSAARR